jgi:hypothetical protein
VATWSAELHQAALRVLAGTMAAVIDSSALIEAWGTQRDRDHKRSPSAPDVRL